MGYLHRRRSPQRLNNFKWARTIGFCNLNTHEGEEMAFIEHKTWLNYPLAIYYYLILG